MATDIKKLLDTLDGAMGWIKTIADLPGVNAIPYVSTLSTVISVGHALYDAGGNIEPMLDDIKESYSGKPTPEKLEALKDRIAILRAEVQAPAPPPEDGEPTT